MEEAFSNVLSWRACSFEMHFFLERVLFSIFRTVLGCCDVSYQLSHSPLTCILDVMYTYFWIKKGRQYNRVAMFLSAMTEHLQSQRQYYLLGACNHLSFLYWWCRALVSLPTCFIQNLQQEFPRFHGTGSKSSFISTGNLDNYLKIKRGKKLFVRPLKGQVGDQCSRPAQ